MPTEYMFKRSMTVGSGTAESDGEFLEQCFVQTPEYETLLDYSDHKMILLGRTGSGKTALLKMVQKKIDVYIQVKPDTFAMQYISNIPFVRELNDLGINLEIFYKFLWLHEIMSRIIKEYFAYNRKNFLSQLIDHVSNQGRISEMKKYFEEYGDVFFEEKSAENITQLLESKICASLGSSKVASLGGEVTESVKKELQTRASACVNSTQINQLKNIISMLGEYLSKNKQRKIFVAIDDLDTNWIADKTKYQLIGALLSAIRLFLDVPNLKIVLAMRSDVLRKTCIETGRQNEKDEAFTLRLNWTKEMLWDILSKRVQYLFTHKYQKRYAVGVGDVFAATVGSETTSDYLISRTMMRPRDLITFVNYCIEQSTAKSIIDARAIKLAERDYRHNRSAALVAEWKDVYPSVEILIKLLYKLPNEFSFDILQEYYRSFEEELYALNNMEDPLVKSFLGDSQDSEGSIVRNLKELLNVWFLIGIVGKQEGDDLVFSTPNHPCLDEIDFADAMWFEAHPLFAH